MHQFLISLALMFAGLFVAPAITTAQSACPTDDTDCDPEDGLLFEARDSLQRGNPVVAVTLLHRLTTHRPDDPAGWKLLAEALAALDRDATATDAPKRS